MRIWKLQFEDKAGEAGFSKLQCWDKGSVNFEASKLQFPDK
jgi:hypothetical protein